MNYHSKPDINPNEPLTVDDVILFQRFQQDADRKTLDDLLEAEVARHLKLCELAILYYASCTFYWCELPRHPIGDVNTWAFAELEKRGFTIEHRPVGVHRNVADDANRPQQMEALQSRTYPTASWGNSVPSQTRQKEWRRRESLENIERTKNPPQPRSKIVYAQVVESDAIWASVVDKKHLVEVQRIRQRTFLCLFELSGKCLHCEETHEAFSAMAGPDLEAMAKWKERARVIVDARDRKRAHRPSDQH